MTFITQNFELLLFILVVVSGGITLFDKLFLAPKRRERDMKKLPWAVDYARSFFPVLLVVFIIRSFIVEPYRIPSGSLKPTLQTGDYIIVNKFAYGLRLPVFHNMILPIKEPKRGDIAVFRYPPEPSIDYIKRIIGVPGDHVVYKDKILTINGTVIPEKLLNYAIETEPTQGSFKVEKMRENLLGVRHNIYINPDVTSIDFDVTVPPGQYFALGDNRDNSNDSRYWGMVPEQNLIGQALCVLVSWDSNTDSVRWSRIGKMIH